MYRPSHKIATLMFALLLLAPALPAVSGQPRAGDSLTARVDKLFAQWDRKDSPGCALAVVRDGRVVYQRGYGMADLQHGIPISTNSVFDTASVSKQFTAMCMALLAEQGKISLDDDIRKFFPEMPAYGAPVTVRHLIHHTGGVRDYLTLMGLRGMRPDDFYTEEEVMDIIARQKELNFKPGDEFLYSNSGYFLMSQIVKRVTGKTLRQYADEHIFKPLGMTNTRFYDDHTEIVPGRAIGYAPRRGGGFQISVTTLDMVGDGNVFTTIEDLVKWDANFYNNKLGKGGPALIELTTPPGKLNNGESTGYAFGLAVGEYKGLKTIHHGGAFVGYRAHLLRFPEERFTVLLTCNLASMNPDRLAYQVADIYLADRFKKEEKAAAEMGPVKIIELPAAKLDAYAGTYRSPATGAIWKVWRNGSRLSVQLPGIVVPLAPVSESEFHAVDAPVELTARFESSESGLALSATTPGLARPLRFERIEVVKVEPAQLPEYAGEYYSEELDVTYRVVVEQDHLFVRHANRFRRLPPGSLQPLLKDRFSLQSAALMFERDASGRVNAFTLNVGRVKNIRFVRK